MKLYEILGNFRKIHKKTPVHKPLFKKRRRPQKRLFYRTHLDDCFCLYHTRDWKIRQPLEDLKIPAKIKLGKEILKVQEIYRH